MRKMHINTYTKLFLHLAHGLWSPSIGLELSLPPLALQILLDYNSQKPWPAQPEVKASASLSPRTSEEPSLGSHWSEHTCAWLQTNVQEKWGRQCLPHIKTSIVTWVGNDKETDGIKIMPDNQTTPTPLHYHLNWDWSPFLEIWRSMAISPGHQEKGRLPLMSWGSASLNQIAH